MKKVLDSLFLERDNSLIETLKINFFFNLIYNTYPKGYP